MLWVFGIILINYQSRSYGIFEIDEQDFDSGYEKLKNIFSEIRNNVPEYKYKFEPVYDCLKAKQDAEEVYLI